MAIPIRPKDLPPGSPLDSAAIPFDSGAVVEKATPLGVVDAAIPLASQAEAEAGSDNVKRVTPLRVKQAVSAYGVLSASLIAGTGSSLVGFLQSGTGAVVRTQEAKTRETASPTDYSGATDSDKFEAALTAKSNLTLPAGSSFTFGDVVLSDGQSIYGNGASVSSGTSTNLVVLSDFSPRFVDTYIADSALNTDPAIRIKESRFARVSGITAPNAKNGFLHFAADDPATGSVSWGSISLCKAETIEGVGVDIESSVNDFIFSDISLFGKYGTGTGGYKPWTGSIGWRQITPVIAGRAVGGHFSTNQVIINFDKGMVVEDGQLSKHSNMVIDATSDWGLDVSGASQDLDFADLFVGTSRGIRVADSSVVNIDGLRTIFNGLVPPGGASDFFTGAAYDVRLEGTARLTVSGAWAGDKKISVASTAKLALNTGDKFRGRTGTIGANVSTFIFETGSTPTEEDAIFRVFAPGTLVGFSVAAINAPGSGQSFTLTVRKNFADTALSGVISGASSFGGDFWSTSGVKLAPFDVVSLKLVTSASAANSRFQTIMYFVYD